MAGLLIGFGVGAVLGCLRFALMETINPTRGLLILMPEGPLAGGILGGIIMGVIGGVIGLITGLLGLHVAQAAVAGLLIFVLLLLRSRAAFAERTYAIRTYLNGGSLNLRSLFMDILFVTLFLDFAAVGVLVAVFLRYWFGEVS